MKSLISSIVSLLLILQAQAKPFLTFSEVWQVMRMPLGQLDGWMAAKGYPIKTKSVNSWQYRVPGNAKAAAVELSFTWYDSTHVSGIAFEDDNANVLAVAQDLAANDFTGITTADTITAVNQQQSGITEFESVRYFLFASVIRQYPQQGRCLVRFSWHDLMTQSMAVIAKGNNPYLTPAVVKELDSLKAEPYSNAQTFAPLNEPALFPGGQRAMYIYLNHHVAYPPQAVKDSAEGIVEVFFTITKEGKVTNVQPGKVTAAGKGLAEEAVRLFRNMPVWRPRKQSGELVQSQRLRQLLVFKIKPVLTL